MTTMLIISYAGFDYWLMLSGEVMYKPVLGFFWESHLGNLPDAVKIKFGITTYDIVVSGSGKVVQIWKGI